MIAARISDAAAKPSRGLPLAWLAAKQDALLGLGVFLCILAVYVRTAAPTLYSLDAAEFAVSIWTWGIPHATGYPLFVLLGRLFVTLYPFGEVAYRVTLLTAILAALVPAVLFAVLRELRVRPVPAVLACLFFAVSYYQWSSAVVAKEHSLHDLLLAAMLWLLLRWHGRGQFAYLAAATAAGGLAITNHMAAALYAPILVAFVLVKDWLGWQRLLVLAGLALVSLTPYLYLPLAYLAHPAFNVAGSYDIDGGFHPVNLASVPGLVWMLSARQFSFMMLSTGGNLFQDLAQFGLWLWGNFFGVGVVLGVFGFKAFARRNRWFCSLTVCLALAHAAFFLSYSAPDRDAMFVPVYMLWALPLAFGLSSAAAIIRARRWRRPLVAGSLLAIAVASYTNFRLLDLSSDRRVKDWAAEFLSNVPPNSVVLARWISSGPLQYMILVEGDRPDVTVIDRFLMPPAVMAEFIERHVDERPIVVDAGDLVDVSSDPTLAADILPGRQGSFLSRGGDPAFPGILLRRAGAQPNPPR